MGKFVIDMFINSIVYVEDDELILNKFRYKIVSEKKLRDIGNKNYKKVIKTIKENNPNGYYHLSMKPMTNFIDTSQKGTKYIGKTNLYYNPVGLYMSCGKNYYDVNIAQNGGFNGKISNLRYYDRALSAFEINSIVSTGPNTSTSSLALSNVNTSANYLSSLWYTQ